MEKRNCKEANAYAGLEGRNSQGRSSGRLWYKVRVPLADALILDSIPDGS